MKHSFEPQLIGRSIIHFESIHSTNTHAMELIAKNKPIEGTVITSDFQSAGKGQRNNIWQSDKKKNILLSIIVYPNFLSVSQQFFLSMATANAIVTYLQTVVSAEKLSVKWPNDIYFENKKIGGILIQNNLRKDQIESSVIGIGLNINQDLFESDIPNPVSLSQISGEKYDLMQVKLALLEHIDTVYQNLKMDRRQEIKSQYEGLLYNLGVESTINCSSGSLKGHILGIENDGRLLVNVDGKVKKLIF